jgi:hypothetical protein
VASLPLWQAFTSSLTATNVHSMAKALSLEAVMFSLMRQFSRTYSSSGFSSYVKYKYI